MMTDALDYTGLTRMLLGAVAQIRENHKRLSELDSYGGDGDHGTTMFRAMENLKKALEASRSDRMDALLGEIAWAVMGTDGGATGPLFGSFFMGMSEGTAGKESLGAAALAGVFEAALASLRKQTRAQVGDKTVVDALVPAVQAAREAADKGLGLVAVLETAAEAAAVGAAGTRDLQPRMGRAKNARQQSVGHEDPGAVSVSLMFKGFVEGVQSDGG
jgi:dihydroxyacetone kinase-like protein